MDYFPTQEGVWNTTGAFNTGSFSDPKANNLMTQSVFGKNASAVDDRGRLLLQEPAGPVLPRPGLHVGGELEDGQLDLAERLDRPDPAAVLPAVLVREEVVAEDE